MKLFFELLRQVISSRSPSESGVSWHSTMGSRAPRLQYIILFHPALLQYPTPGILWRPLLQAETSSYVGLALACWSLKSSDSHGNFDFHLIFPPHEAVPERGHLVIVFEYDSLTNSSRKRRASLLPPDLCLRPSNVCTAALTSQSDLD